MGMRFSRSMRSHVNWIAFTAALVARVCTTLGDAKAPTRNPMQEEDVELSALPLEGKTGTKD